MSLGPTAAAAAPGLRIGAGSPPSPALRALPVAMVAVAALVPLRVAPAGALAGTLAVATAAAVWSRRPEWVHLGIALTGTVALIALIGPLSWPLPAAGGLLLAGPLLPRLRRSGFADWRAGRLGRQARLWMVVISVVAAAVLVVDARFGGPLLFTATAALRRLPVPVVLVAGIGYATINAAVEEALFRGVVLSRLRESFGLLVALPVQAVAFGAIHLHGFPTGSLGVALASTYGLALGLLRLRTGGLLAPWLTHVTSDAVIFLIIFFGWV